MRECCQLDAVKGSGRLSHLLVYEKRQERESLLTQPPLWKSSHQFVRRDVVYQNSRPGSPPSGRGGTTCSPLLEIRNVPFTVRVRKIKPTVSESSVTDIDTLHGQKSTCCCFSGGRGCFPPAVLPPFPSQPSPRHHLWLGLHLFRITILPRDLRLTLESHFSRNDNEFEDKSWKNTLLWQLRFPWVIDKCDRVGAIRCFPLGRAPGQQNILVVTCVAWQR